VLGALLATSHAGMKLLALWQPGNGYLDIVRHMIVCKVKRSGCVLDEAFSHLLPVCLTMRKKEDRCQTSREERKVLERWRKARHHCIDRDLHVSMSVTRASSSMSCRS
jgi:hypothetical protein